MTNHIPPTLADLQLPIGQRPALPLTMSTKLIPSAIAWQYAPSTEDGVSSLTDLNADDHASVLAHVDHIANGRIRVLPRGETTATMAAAEKERQAMAGAIGAAIDNEYSSALGRQAEARQRRAAQEAQRRRFEAFRGY